MRNLAVRALRKAARVIAGDPPPTIYITDEFVTWLCFANAGMLEKGNVYLVDYAISRLSSDAPMLEIGSFCGLSANLLTYYKHKYGRSNPLFTCDKWEFENRMGDCVGDSSISFEQYKEFVRDSYLRNIKTFSQGDFPFTVEALSVEFFNLWRENKATRDVFDRPVTLGGPLSFCYIDGEHTYEGAKADFENCDKFLQVGGFILFDDSALEYMGVSRLMLEVLATGRYKLIARNPNHLFQRMKR
jgi:methyltransferase family protein